MPLEMFDLLWSGFYSVGGNLVPCMFDPFEKGLFVVIPYRDFILANLNELALNHINMVKPNDIGAMYLHEAFRGQAVERFGDAHAA